MDCLQKVIEPPNYNDLPQRQMASSQYGIVHFIFGVRPMGSDSKLRLQPGVDFAHPQAQLFLKSVCDFMLEQPIARLHQCWMRNFAAWVPRNSDDEFPVPRARFIQLVRRFFSETDNDPSHVGMHTPVETGEEEIFFVRFVFPAWFDQQDGWQALKPYYHDWSNAMEAINTAAVSYVGVGFQSSEQWVRMKVQESFEKGVVWGLAISISMVAVTLVVLTRFDLRLTVAAVLTVLCVVLSVFGGLVASGLKMGAMEFIALQILVGFSVDYVLHLGHSYAHSTFVSRFGRAREAFRRMGGSVVSAAVTTLLPSVVLMFCIIRPLALVGRFLFTVTLVAGLYSIFGFIPLLTLMGSQPRSGLERDGAAGRKPRKAKATVKKSVQPRARATDPAEIKFTNLSAALG